MRVFLKRVSLCIAGIASSCPYIMIGKKVVMAGVRTVRGQMRDWSVRTYGTM